MKEFKTDGTKYVFDINLFIKDRQDKKFSYDAIGCSCCLWASDFDGVIVEVESESSATIWSGCILDIEPEWCREVES